MSTTKQLPFRAVYAVWSSGSPPTAAWRESPHRKRSDEELRQLYRGLEQESFKDYPTSWIYECGRFWVIGMMGVVDDRLELIGLDIRAFPGPSGRAEPITAGGTLRRIPLAAIIEDAARRYEESTRKGGPLPQGMRPPRVKVRGRYSDEDLGTVADLYDEAIAHGSRAPSRHIAKALGIDPARARKMIFQARRKRLLPPTQARKPRGNPTTKGAK